MIGKTLGHYQILSRLGKGGMGEVFRAHDSQLGRDVAVKVLPEAFAANAERTGRFKREARVLASLNHPNIASIYGIEESGSGHALIMELVQGRTLAQRIATEPIQIEEAVSISRQIGEAVAYANERGIIHRDLKPSNIMITEGGLVKVLDFGLAKLAETPAATAADTTTFLGTETGAVVGTIGYMSPEQLRGLPLDHRSDLFSLGAVLYEMVTGARPFEGSSPTAVADAILHAQPRDFGDSPAPAKLKAIIRKLLEKDPANRYGSAAGVVEELKALEISLAPVRPVRLPRKVWIAVGAAVVLVGALAGWLWRGLSRERWALQTAMPEIRRLIDAGEYVKAAVLTREARAALPKDPTLEKLWMSATNEASITSVPSDAVVSIRSYRGNPNAWDTVGKTPLQKVRLPRDAYVWRVAKPGFVSAFFIAELGGPPIPDFPSSPVINMTATLTNRPNIKMVLKLRPEGGVPHEMVVVPGGRIGLGYPVEQAPAAQVDDFLIDRHEVTNEEYMKFVKAGGYRNRALWKQPFVKDRRTIPWEDAMAIFQDATGRPGPATWEVGDYPKGHEKYPVAGVSWYEAAAYAEFAGKSLPTAYHWTRASQSSFYTPLIASGSNFGGEGTQPVGSERALSGFGTTDMAGNVKEWCLNEVRESKRLILGGGFGEPNYMFHNTDAQSPWERRPNFGFRCVKLDSPPTTAAAANIEVTIRDYWKEKPASDDVFQAYTALYAYDKGELNALLEETALMEISLREKVTFDAAYGRERVIAYLFLPKDASPPFQTVVYFPAVMAFLNDKLDLSSIEETRGFLLKSRRALLFPIYRGMYERRHGFNPFTSPPAAFRDHTIAWAKDLSRSLDYLETRNDIDNTKVAFFGDSVGGMEAPLLLALEKRIRAAILVSGGFHLTMHYLPEADPFNFVKHAAVPMLMLSGRYDTTYPLESSQRPLFHLLGTPEKDKKLVVYEGGHCAFPRPAAVRECLDWLDMYLGPVVPQGR